MKTLSTLMLAILLLSTPAFSQWSAGLYVGMLVDDNSFNNYLQINDRITELSLGTGYEWETEESNLGLSYSGVLNAFAVIPSRTFSVHSAAASYDRLFGEEEATLLTTGLTYSLRDNRDKYTVYDHTQLSLQANLRHYVSESFLIKGGYAFRSASFAELPDFDYVEHALFVQSGWTLPTRTTILLQADIDFKKYLTSNIDTAASLSSGYGYRRQRGSESTPGVTQIIGTLKIGQGIAQGTGLSVMGQYQVSLQKESRYLTFSDGTLTDDELFDDHYGYEGPLVNAMLTQFLPADIRVRVSGTLQQRRYNDRPAFDLAGIAVDAQRIDTRSTYLLLGGKAFRLPGHPADPCVRPDSQFIQRQLLQLQQQCGGGPDFLRLLKYHFGDRFQPVRKISKLSRMKLPVNIQPRYVVAVTVAVALLMIGTGFIELRQSRDELYHLLGETALALAETIDRSVRKQSSFDGNHGGASCRAAPRQCPVCRSP